MPLPVIVKSTKKGICLMLDSEMPFPDLLEKIREKFTESRKFFQNSHFAISFGGRTLDTEEERAVINTISESCGAEIVCIFEENELLDTYLEKRIQQLEEEKTMKSGHFFRGDIQPGQTLESEHSVIIMGNVRKGGKVISRGNIVILGTLEGYAFAGAGGNISAFICALHIKTDQLRIADVLAECARYFPNSHMKRKKETPQTAVAKDDTIIIEPLTKGFLNSI